MKKLLLSLLGLAAACTMVLPAHRASAQADYPAKTIRILVPFSTGTGLDSGAVREILGEEITLEAPQLESRRLPGLTDR